MSNNGRNDTRDYGRNGEIVTAATAAQISSQLQTTGTSTPALVAQALSGNALCVILLDIGKAF